MTASCPCKQGKSHRPQSAHGPAIFTNYVSSSPIVNRPASPSGMPRRLYVGQVRALNGSQSLDHHPSRHILIFPHQIETSVSVGKNGYITMLDDDGNATNQPTTTASRTRPATAAPARPGALPEIKHKPGKGKGPSVSATAAQGGLPPMGRTVAWEGERLRPGHQSPLPYVERRVCAVVQTQPRPGAAARYPV